MLAGVSVDYYARLEQGRGSTPSIGVVSAVARALQCDRDQRDHMLHLAGHPVPPRSSDGHVRPGLIAVANRLVDLPAVIVTDLGEIVWENSLGRILLDGLAGEPGRGRNLIWEWFADPDTRAMPPEHWDRISAAHVSDLRATYARRSGEAHVRKFVQDLIAVSDEFKELWERHDVAVDHSDTKVVSTSGLLLEFDGRRWTPTTTSLCLCSSRWRAPTRQNSCSCSALSVRRRSHPTET